MRSLQLALKAALLEQSESLDLSGFRENAMAARSERFAVYANAYRLRLQEAIGEDFDRVANHISATDFETLMRDYSAANPSESWTLADAGRLLPKYIRETAPWNTYPFLDSVAERDLLRTHAFLASGSAAPRGSLPFSLRATVAFGEFSQEAIGFFKNEAELPYLLDEKPGNTGGLLVYRQDLAGVDYALEEVLLVGKSAQVWRGLETLDDESELTALLARLGYDAAETQALFYAFASRGLLRPREGPPA